MSAVRLALAALVLFAMAPLAGAKPPRDYRVVYLLGPPREVGTVRVALDDGAEMGSRIIRQISACVYLGDGFSLCVPTINKRRRVDRGATVEYSGARATTGPRRRVSLRAKFRGDDLVRFGLRYSSPTGTDTPIEMRRYGIEDVTFVEVLPIRE